LVVGLLGWFVPQVLGVGYGFVDQALNGKLLIATMALLVGLKLIATATCYASGNAGGIFGPSLFMGAMTGGAIGGVAHWLLPDYTGSVGAYALVGMGAAFAGTIRVPLTSVIMIFEITRDYSIIVPLMIANLLSYFISSRLQEESVYEALQHQDGIHLPSGARAREDLITVAHALKPEIRALPATLSVAQALSSVDPEHVIWPVTDEKGLRGMISKDQLEAAASSGFGEQTLGDLVPDPGPIEDLNEAHFPHVHPDHSLQSAMRRLAESGLPELPVVSRSNIRELRGTISAKDVLDAFAIGRPAAAAVAETKASPKLFAGVLTVLMAMALLMGFLNYYFRLERTNRASSYFREAQALMERGSYEEAIERYRDALSASHSVDYRLALGLALVKAGDSAEAPIYLNEVLREKPGNGPANLGLARAALQQGRVDDAVAHYQRAIYGAWPAQQRENQFQARVELIDGLGKAGRRQQAQAELLATAAAIPDDDRFKRQVARMMIDYGLPKAAENLFRDMAQRNPRDAAAIEGLGDAAFANADYAAASDAYRAGLALDPGSSEIARRAGLCGRILALELDRRGLGAGERYERSLKILSGVADELGHCGGGDKDAAQQAQAALARKQRPASYSDAADANRALALELWSARPAACTVGDEALTRVMAQLAAH
jgi:tetratricopeptide (TPR) repeat protein/CBS domain-containing protein